MPELVSALRALPQNTVLDGDQFEFAKALISLLGRGSGMSSLPSATAASGGAGIREDSDEEAAAEGGAVEQKVDDEPEQRVSGERVMCMHVCLRVYACMQVSVHVACVCMNVCTCEHIV